MTQQLEKGSNQRQQKGGWNSAPFAMAKRKTTQGAGQAHAQAAPIPVNWLVSWLSWIRDGMLALSDAIHAQAKVSRITSILQTLPER